MAERVSSTKQLKRVLGFGDLMGTAIGQIIGAGIMTLLGSAMAITGRSLPIAFLIAAIITIGQYVPLIYISGTVRLRGGNYTAVAMLAGKKYAGAFCIIYFLSRLSFAMYCLSFASYFCDLFLLDNAIYGKWVAFAVLTIFFILNIMGIDKFAKFQNVIVILLCVALGMFAAMGIGHVDWAGYYSKDTFLTGGLFALFQAGGLLTFATGGANVIINLSAEAKNPTRDIPIVMIISTLCVAVLYGVIAFVASGVLPLEQVAGKNLTVVANVILSRPLYVFFIVCGAGFALISTLNASFAWSPKPTMQACDDGWFPHGLARLSKWKTPYILLTFFYVLGAVCIFTGLSVATLSNMCVLGNAVINIMINSMVWRLPKTCPEAWETSKFKTSAGVLMFAAIVGTVASGFNAYLNASRLSTNLLILNLAAIAFAFIFGVVRSKHVDMEVSYELPDAE